MSARKVQSVEEMMMRQLDSHMQKNDIRPLGHYITTLCTVNLSVNVRTIKCQIKHINKIFKTMNHANVIYNNRSIVH